MSKDSAAPPAYDGAPTQGPPPAIEDLSLRLNGLKLQEITDTPTPDQCIAHLKFLEALYQLRESIANHDGLFGIATPPEKDAEKLEEKSRISDAQIRVREKRWAVYVARAVDRFETWWTECIPCTVAGRPTPRLTKRDYLKIDRPEEVPVLGQPIAQLQQNHLPPLDVLMVWHAYTLNPRCFLEDCVRYQKLDFYATPFPWQYIDRCIDSETFEYTAPRMAVERWTSGTKHAWAQLEDPMVKTMRCPNTLGTSAERPHDVSFPWTQGFGITEYWNVNPGNGFADAEFEGRCSKCNITFTHDYLRVQKFRNDMLAWNRSEIPMAGTILGREGLPEKPKHGLRVEPSCFTPNLILKASSIYSVLEECTQPRNSGTTMETIKGYFELAVKDQKTLRSGGVPGGRLVPSARVSIRRMFSRYWYNSSPFALDLVGAVIRQGSFIEKMHSIDWLHSPALQSTMLRLIQKYGRFLQIMKDNPRKLVVPTLDVDLAWHTHQLSPQQYCTHTLIELQQLVDHDDKIAESDLSAAFEWTSKTYARLYNEAYSQCTCWYCEAVREKGANVFSRLSKTKSEQRQPEEGCPSDPLKSAHISAHNAVRDAGDARDQARAKVRAAELDKAYHKACARARKRGKAPPQRDEYFYAYAYGYPFFVPIYYPYAVDPCIGNSGAYAAPPCDVNTAAGSYGACAAGTCGGGAAMGGCASAGGGCGGGGGGGCGGGGGGGGGCGGGGGGCGGGGG